jgi:hypothetical protein
MRMLAVATLLSLLAPGPAWAAEARPTKGKTLADLNALTRILAPQAEVVPAELGRLIEVAEVVAARDGTRLPSPMAIAYAAALEKSLETPNIPGGAPRATRVLVDLALALAGFGGPESEALEQAFLPSLLATLKVSPAEAKPRPELTRELAEVGEWAAAAVNRLAPRLPAKAAAMARVRLAIDRGRYTDAAAIARQNLQSQSGVTVDPRWQAWLAAALVLKGEAKQAAPYVAAAEASGGEAERIVRNARVKRIRETAAHKAARGLKAAGVSYIPVSAGGKPQGLADACRLLLGPKTHTATAEGVLGCANVLWDDPGREWLTRALALAPKGVEGAPLRAAAALRALFAPSSTEKGRTSELETQNRKNALARYLEEVGAIALLPNERRVVMLLGYLGASANPFAWVPGPEEQKLLQALEAEAPCDSAAFPLRAVAARVDRAELGRFVTRVVTTCVDAPGGAAITLDAIGLMLQLAYEAPTGVPGGPAAIEPLVLKLAQKHPNNPHVVAAHADAVALKALSSGKPNPIGLEAALARYEEALAQTTAAGGSAARQRIDANAGYLSLALGRLAGDKDAAKRGSFYTRAAHHLRFALAYGEIPAVTATRAAFDLDTGTGTTTTQLELLRVPPGRTRARVACTLAAEAVARGDSAAKKYLELATAPAPADERKLAVEELLVDTTANFSVLLDDAALRPLVELKTALYLAPACNPAAIKRPSAAAAKTAPAPVK